MSDKPLAPATLAAQSLGLIEPVTKAGYPQRPIMSVMLNFDCDNPRGKRGLLGTRRDATSSQQPHSSASEAARQNCFRLSTSRVTGPSLTSSTSMCC